MPSDNKAILIARSREEVFDYLVEPANQSIWHWGAAHGPPTTWTTQVRPGLLEAIAEDRGIRERLRLELRSDPGGTLLTLRLDYHASGWMRLVLLAGGWFTRDALGLQLDRIRAAVEDPDRSDASSVSSDWPAVVRADWVDRGPSLTVPFQLALAGAVTIGLVLPASQVRGVGSVLAAACIAVALACIAATARLLRRRHAPWRSLLTLSADRLEFTQWRSRTPRTSTLLRSDAGRLRRFGGGSELSPRRASTAGSGSGLKLYDTAGRLVLKLDAALVELESTPDWLLVRTSLGIRMADLVRCWWPDSDVRGLAMGGWTIAIPAAPGEPDPVAALEAFRFRRLGLNFAVFGVVLALAGVGAQFVPARPDDHELALALSVIGVFAAMIGMGIRRVRGRIRAGRPSRSG